MPRQYRVLIWDGSEAEVRNFLGPCFLRMEGDEAIAKSTSGQEVPLKPGHLLVLPIGHDGPPMFFQQWNYDWMSYLFE